MKMNSIVEFGIGIDAVELEPLSHRGSVEITLLRVGS